MRAVASLKDFPQDRVLEKKYYRDALERRSPARRKAVFGRAVPEAGVPVHRTSWGEGKGPSSAERDRSFGGASYGRIETIDAHEMTHMPSFIRAQGDCVLLSVKVQPRANKTEISGLLGDELKIKVTAPPVDAAANEALIQLLAETLDCSRNRVALVRGHTSRRKIIQIHGITPEEVVTRLLPKGV